MSGFLGLNGIVTGQVANYDGSFEINYDTSEIYCKTVYLDGIPLSTLIENSGIQGPQGIPGPKGDSATIQIGNVLTLESSQLAYVNNSGTDSNIVLNFGLPRGVSGIDGKDGNAATIEIGDVTTVPATNSATVTNSGTSTNAVFNFAIPRGYRGDQGDKGDKGEKGDKGDKGDDGSDGSDGSSPSIDVIITALLGAMGIASVAALTAMLLQMQAQITTLQAELTAKTAGIISSSLGETIINGKVFVQSTNPAVGVEINGFTQTTITDKLATREISPVLGTSLTIAAAIVNMSKVVLNEISTKKITGNNVDFLDVARIREICGCYLKVRQTLTQYTQVMNRLTVLTVDDLTDFEAKTGPNLATVGWTGPQAAIQQQLMQEVGPFTDLYGITTIRGILDAPSVPFNQTTNYGPNQLPTGNPQPQIQPNADQIQNPGSFGDTQRPSTNPFDFY